VCRRERRPAIGRGNLLRAGDRRSEGIIRFQIQNFGDVENGIFREWCGAIEAAPSDQHPSRRSRIIGAVAQKESVAQHRRVLAAARHPDAGRGGLQCQAAPPYAGPWRVGAHARVESGERRAGEIGALTLIGDSRIDARPRRKRRQWWAVGDLLLRTADHGRGYHMAALQSIKTVTSAGLVTEYRCPIRLHYRTRRSLDHP
jgi:hypothetical protein